MSRAVPSALLAGSIATTKSNRGHTDSNVALCFRVVSAAESCPAGDDSEEGAASLDEAAALAKAEAEADEQIVAAQERLMGELKRAVARWLMDAGWSSEQVEGFYTVHGESDGGAAGFYWGADGSRDPFWWSGGG